MILPIVLYGNDILRRNNKDISIRTNVNQLIKDMFETMNNAHGVGLAAPQVGKNIKLFVADVSYFEKNEYNKKKFVAINPILEFPQNVEYTEETEGCLSIPQIGAKVKRPNEVIIKYYDENFKYKEESYHGWSARVIQHETDHLLKRLYIDYIECNTRLNEALEKITSGEIVPDYDYIQ